MKSVGDEGSSWTAGARCADMASDVFFPSDSVGVIKAIAICVTCPVRQACLEHALEHGIVEGIWGGESERSRRRIRAARRQRA